MSKLAGLRVTAGFTQKEVADRLGVSQGAISIWERGDGKPHFNKIPLLASLYGVESQDIVDACISSNHKSITPLSEVLDNGEREQIVLQNLS